MPVDSKIPVRQGLRCRSRRRPNDNLSGSLPARRARGSSAHYTTAKTGPHLLRADVSFVADQQQITERGSTLPSEVLDAQRREREQKFRRGVPITEAQREALDVNWI